MPSYLSWIGEKDSPGFYWDDAPDDADRGNTPRWLAPKDRVFGLGLSYYWYERMEEAGRYPCQQLDWGAWGVAVTRQDCLQLWDEIRPDAGASGFKRWDTRRQDLEAALEDGRMYVICVAEMP